MALFIQSRDGIQCRSHHMKQLRTHKQVRKIILNYEQKIEEKVYETCNEKFYTHNSDYGEKEFLNPTFYEL